MHIGQVMYFSVNTRGFEGFLIWVWFGVGQLTFSKICHFLVWGVKGGSQKICSCSNILVVKFYLFRPKFFFYSPKEAKFLNWSFFAHFVKLLILGVQKKYLGIKRSEFHHKIISAEKKCVNPPPLSSY